MPVQSPAPKAKPVPDGFRTVTPHLICAGAADAIEFYKKAFGATEMFRLPGPDGRLMHASVMIGDSMVMLVDEMKEMGSLGPKTRGGSSVGIHLQVEDADAERAIAFTSSPSTAWPSTSPALNSITGTSLAKSVRVFASATGSSLQAAAVAPWKCSANPASEKRKPRPSLATVKACRAGSCSSRSSMSIGTSIGKAG